MPLLFGSVISLIKNHLCKAEVVIESAEKVIEMVIDEAESITSDENKVTENVTENTRTEEIVMSEVDKVASALKALLIAAGHQIGEEYDALVSAAKSIAAKP